MKIYNTVIINMMTNEVIYEDSYEYNGPIAKCGGGGGDTVVQAPTPSAEEIELQREQLAILRQSRAESQAIQPYLLQSMGLAANADGSYRRMTDEEITANMTQTERNAQEALNLSQERQIAALEGKLPVSPALEEDLTKQRTGLTESLAQRLGTGWETTTSGIQSMSEFDKRAELLREEARRGEISSGTGLVLNQMGYLTGSNTADQASYGNYSNRLNSLISSYGQAQQPYQYYSGLKNQANIYNAQANAQQTSGLMGGLGSLLGSGIRAVGTYAGLSSLRR